ncbi:MAG: thiamine pyrophosphate-binding protein [Planctomycetes bacterium]|nr:thiamine pyrophosphate-binding protein [Planctomycetota bacterium]
MRRLVDRFLSRRLPRRAFLEGLGALGLSAAGIQAVLQASQAAERGPPGSARNVTGTGGDLMVAQMKAAGVRFLFTNPGSFEVGFFDAFLDQAGMQLILGLHEGIVISLADGYHKVSREPAFVNLHVIAGTAQASGQLYNSSRDGSALVVTAGLLDNEVYSDDVLLGPRPGFDQKDVNRQFTKISWECREAASIPAMLRRAFKVSTTEPGGPVYLAIPNHVLEKRAVAADVYERRHFMIPAEVPPAPELIDEAARMLLEAKDPLLFLGDDVWKAGAQLEALELAELLALPVAQERISAFHSFPRRHRLCLRRWPERYKDVVLSVGARDLGDRAVPRDALRPQAGKMIRIGLNTDHIGRDHPFDLAIVANVKRALRALTDTVKASATKERLEGIRGGRPDPGARPPEVAAETLGLTPMHPDELGWVLEEELDRDAIIVSENLSGSSQFFSTGFREDEKMWLANTGVGLGWGVGAAAGAKLAAPDRQVVSSIGDGSVMYSASGFWTQARYEIPVLTVVWNNLNYQTVRHSYHGYGGRMKEANRYHGMYLGDPDIDFVKLAGSQGVEGARVERPGELRQALRRAIAATREGRPYLVDVAVRRVGGGADSTWHQRFSLAEARKRKA